jgi:pyrroline-5-carboxylate reductase
MAEQLGFIGAGNMAQAIFKGILKIEKFAATDIHIYDPDAGKLQQLTEAYGVMAEASNINVCTQADVLFLCTKPTVYPAVISEIKSAVKANTVIVTIAAGQSIRQIESRFEKKIHLIRVMPNTPALVGEGMAALAANALATDAELALVLSIFRSLGKAEMVPESLMDAVTGLSGSAPAFVFMFIEALADGAVQTGMPRAQAYTFAAQTVLGSAKMVLESGKHPGELKDMVTSPAGTTIEGVLSLETDGFRNAVANAVMAAAKKSRMMGK